MDSGYCCFVYIYNTHTDSYTSYNYISFLLCFPYRLSLVLSLGLLGQ
jgi:hypothetical protein